MGGACAHVQRCLLHVRCSTFLLLDNYIDEANKVDNSILWKTDVTTRVRDAKKEVSNEGRRTWEEVKLERYLTISSTSSLFYLSLLLL